MYVFEDRLRKKESASIPKEGLFVYIPMIFSNSGGCLQITTAQFQFNFLDGLILQLIVLQSLHIDDISIGIYMLLL
jgi:hypothetical protein